MGKAERQREQATRPQERQRDKPRTAEPWLWNVVLINDDEHTYDYVIRMMQKVFRHTPERAYEIARTVDGQGRAVCFTTHRELAELKCEQVMGFGPDPQMTGCAGAMSAVIEPALGGDGGDEPPDGRSQG